MPLVTANQFQLGRDFSQLGRGFQQGAQLANQFNIGEQRREEAARAGTQFEQEQSVLRSNVLGTLAEQLKGVPLEARSSVIAQNAPELAKFNIDASVFQNADLSDVELDNVIAGSKSFAGKPALTAAQQEFKGLTKGLSEEDILKARRVELGLDARAGISAAERIATDPELTEDVATSEAIIEGKKSAAKETKKLSAQLKLKPKVDAAVVTAVANAKQEADINAEDRSNQKAFDVYNAAKNNLVTALGGTITGPGAGWLPALTADAQIASGAVAMMAPVLKQLFRASGEGTFTDNDQKMLLDMVPTRDTLPEARIAQLAGIDAIVNAKLGSVSEEAKQKTEQQNKFTSSTGIQFTVE